MSENSNIQLTGFTKLLIEKHVTQAGFGCPAWRSRK